MSSNPKNIDESKQDKEAREEIKQLIAKMQSSNDPNEINLLKIKASQLANDLQGATSLLFQIESTANAKQAEISYSAQSKSPQPNIIEASDPNTTVNQQVEPAFTQEEVKNIFAELGIAALENRKLVQHLAETAAKEMNKNILDTAFGVLIEEQKLKSAQAAQRAVAIEKEEIWYQAKLKSAQTPEALQSAEEGHQASIQKRARRKEYQNTQLADDFGGLDNFAEAFASTVSEILAEYNPEIKHSTLTSKEETGSKYASKEEKKAAQKKRREVRREARNNKENYESSTTELFESKSLVTPRMQERQEQKGRTK